MRSGYRIYWTYHAIDELQKTIEYLENNWTDKEIAKLIDKLERTLNIISENPFLYQATGTSTEIRRVVIFPQNSLYYRISKNQIEILSFFSNRQNPDKIKF